MNDLMNEWINESVYVCMRKNGQKNKLMMNEQVKGRLNE